MPETLTREHLIVGEGDADRAFFNALLQERKIDGFQVLAPAGGRQFGVRLRAIRGATGFKHVKTILLVADNDIDPTASFQQVRAEIRAAGGYGVPDAVLQPATAQNHPSVRIMMLPRAGQPGCLETIVLESLLIEVPTLRECLNDYLKCTPAVGWDQSKQAKMRLQCLIAATCKVDPNCSLTHLWSSKKKLRQLLTYAPFDEITEILGAIA